MKKLILFLSIALVFTTFTQCKKYPDGPAISFRGKAERVANTWKVTKYMEDNVDKTSDFNNVYTSYILTTTKSGDYTISYKFMGTLAYNEAGSWKFDSSKKNLILTQSSPNNGTVTTWQILKLYEKEMWVRDIDNNGKVIEAHLIPQ
ncbi:MAG: hypothetical protein JST26_11885 [Bacteroidetes bacterium]|nr:hypothetical protein [Bacteroidota bacterium]